MRRLHGIFGVAITGAGLVTVAPTVSPVPESQVHAVRLTGDGTPTMPLGDGTAFIMGGSGFPIPAQTYVDAADALYLQPHGFTGSAQSLFTPEGFYPTTGVKSLPAFTSELQGAQILDETIQRQIADGNVDADHPVVVFGYSQSSALSSLTMAQLADQGVSPDDVRFVLAGDTAAPNGGFLTRFDVPLGSHPEIPSLGITFGYPTPDLYPTDVYTLEYDGFADFPQYPMNIVSDLNALVGLVLEHLTYLGLEPEQIANAIPLETTADDTLTDYYMIPQDHLPMLDLVRFLPFVGNPLADLLEPDMKVLVNLGYGSITDGWSDGPANVETPFGLAPPDLDFGEIFTALAKGIPEGVTAAAKDLFDPDNYDIIASIAQNPVVEPLFRSAYAVGALGENPDAFFDHPDLQTLFDVLQTLDINSLVGGVLQGPLYEHLLPIADAYTALTTTLPAYDASLFFDNLEDGNLLEAFGLPIAANDALIPIAIAIGLGA